ncbi:hypothetical protein [Streptomyces sp. NPDC096311]|uniref:hypothetical protein n=1 Tax=Streptomyces sp. NPDC096311 TaxID=3366083 RepID=UPI00381072C2
MTGTGSPDDRTDGAFATHKPCPVDGCLGPAQVLVPSPANLSALDDGDHDPVPCRRCGLGVPAEV